MKKLFLVLALLVMSSGLSHAVTVPSPDNDGTILKNSRGGGQSSPIRKYQLVRNGEADANTAGISSGDVVVWDTNSDDGITVTLTTTSADGAIAGIAVTAIATSDAATGSAASDDIGRRNWGYVQVYGPADANITAGGTNTNAVGDVVITSTDSGAVTSFVDQEQVVLSNDQVNNLAGGKVGFFLDAAGASDTSVEVFVQLG